MIEWERLQTKLLQIVEICKKLNKDLSKILKMEFQKS